MSFLDKIVDLFIVKKISKKDLKYPERLDFTKFRSNYNDVLKQAKQNFHNLAEESKKVLFKKEMMQFAEGEIDVTEENIKNFMRQSESEQYSRTMAQMIHGLRVNALYYMYGRNARTPKQALSMYDRLMNIYDLTVFAVLRYFNCERQEYVDWNGDEEKFSYHKNDKENVLHVAIGVLSATNELTDAIVHNNNTKVFEIFNTKLNTNKISDLEADEIFEL